LFLLITTSLVLAGKSIDFTYLVFCYCIFYVTLFGSISSLMLSDEVAKHQRDALTDGLTGLKNRRFFMEQGSKLLSSARRHDFPMSLILCDIDHFKKINDTFGHSTGDLAIKEITKVLSDSVRHEDMLARFGGEEFIVLLPQTSVKGAAEVAERMRVSTEQKVIKVPNSSIQLTASFGISEVRGQDLEANIICADQALYRAKSNGRNRIEIAEIE
jgi:diguanylate cyclase (GGDEF)-like protein